MSYLKGIVFAPHPPIIVPEVGRGKEKEAAATIEGMQKIADRIKTQRPEVIVCITPHGNVFRNGICILKTEKLEGSLRQFGVPDVQIRKTVNQRLRDTFHKMLYDNGKPHILLDSDSAESYDINMEMDHGCMVPLYYIDKAYDDYQIIHVTIGMLEHLELYEIGMLLRDAIETSGFDAMILASGDLSHCLKGDGPYGYNEKGPVFDKMIVEGFREADYASILNIPGDISEPAGECGLKPFVMAIGAADGTKASTQVFSYEGPFGVGYMTAYLAVVDERIESLFEIQHVKRHEEHEKRLRGEDSYVSLARAAVERYAAEEQVLDWNAYKNGVGVTDHAFINRVESEKAGVFVSIHKHEELRGCIGTTASTQKNVAQEIIHNAIEACSRDPRFSPVRADEFLALDIKVDILHPIEPIESEAELDVKKYGVVVEKDYRRGLLLPNLEGVDTITQQIRIAKQKAGIGHNEKVKLFRFEVERHEAKR
ncbi:MAG: AmmeMemoRadiSam system protein A [Firmicutes bacterium]|nr:AmmeMemoRadiSam system protein A [Bacillota bacterium]